MPVFWGALTAAFSRLFASRIGMWVVGALTFLGLNFATNEFLMDPVLDHIRSAQGGLPAAVTAWAGAFGVDQVITIVMSAYVVGLSKRVFLARK